VIPVTAVFDPESLLNHHLDRWFHITACLTASSPELERILPFSHIRASSLHCLRVHRTNWFSLAPQVSGTARFITSANGDAGEDGPSAFLTQFGIPTLVWRARLPRLQLDKTETAEVPGGILC
jgi:hypothetical protein